MQTAHFKDIRSQITPLLNNANSEVLVAMAWFTSSELFEALLSCRRRSVKVELVLLDDAINWMYYAPDFNRLIEAGGTIRIARAEIGKMHHKFCVIDSKTAITGSYNWTYYAERYNIENIFITTEADIVKSYAAEFKRLADKILPAENCIKLSWVDIESRNYDYDIDFYELNNEIGSYVDFYPNAERKVFETAVKQVKTEKFTTEPIVPQSYEPPTHIAINPIDNRFNPISAYNIGIKATNEDGDNDYLMPIITKGNKLPKIGKFTFCSYLETRDDLECKIYYGNSKKATENHLLTQRLVKEITNGRTDEKLQIQIQFTLTPNGDLYAEIRCIETGRAIDIRVSNSNLVSNK